MKHTRLKKKTTRMASLLCLGLAIPASSLLADYSDYDNNELMRLATEARARGDMDAALAKIGALQERSPDNAAIANIQTAWQEEASVGVNGSNGETETTEAPEADPVAELTAEELRQQEEAIRDARAFMSSAQNLFSRGEYSSGLTRLSEAEELLPVNARTAGLIVDIRRMRSEGTLALAEQQLAQGEYSAARETFAAFRSMEDRTRQAERQAEIFARELNNPANIPVESVSPGFEANQEEIQVNILRGRAMFRAGDFENAENEFNLALARDPNNQEAIDFKRRIASILEVRRQYARETTRTEMLLNIARDWSTPTIVDRDFRATEVEVEGDLQRKLREIEIPLVNFSGVPLSRVVETLSNISVEFDRTGISPRGVNFVLIDPQNTNPEVNISLRNMRLGRILDFIMEQVGFQYDFDEDVVSVRPSDGPGTIGLITEIYPISQFAVIRMTGGSGGGAAPSPAVADPFAAPTSPAPTADSDGQSDDIRRFLQRAGVDFANVQGSNLVYDGASIIVTQSRRNQERIRTILAQYAEVKMVQIEAKFLEVQEGAMQELGVQWNFENMQRRRTIDGEEFSRVRGRSQGRELRALDGRDTADRFGSVVTRPVIAIDTDVATETTPIAVPQPIIPSVIDLAQEAGNFATILGRWGEYHVDAQIRALARKSGSDLLSSPKITVLSGQTADIIVAQEFIYPRSYSDPQISATSGDGGSSATISPATPLDFTMRPVGVEMSVTPTVEDDDYHINMTLRPRVTEFEGFVDYGGTAFASAVGIAATLPVTFLQPIFNTREVNTEVTVWDGATVVLGGLTREQTQTVNDKVPLLGDIPLVGRLFRSEGEAYEKRNLLIFVTASLVTPGGSPKNQALRNVQPGAVFQDHYFLTPGGTQRRVPAAE